MRINHPGEFELIAALRERLARAGVASAEDLAVASGDDAAVVLHGGEALAVSVDALVEDVHFTRPAFSPASIGHKAIATALSDIAAMGAEPRHAFVQLGLPDDATLELCLEIADGLAGVAAAHGMTVAGGDVTRAPVLLLAVTVTGRAASADQLVGRDGARAGDVLAVTGELGGAAAGLRLLEADDLAAELDAPLAAELRSRQLEPEPRIDAGLLLARAGASAMIDLSDGLIADAEHLAAAAGVELRIDLERLPLGAGVAEIASLTGTDPLELAATGGEDYELLVTLDPRHLERVRSELAGIDLGLSAIGEVAAGEGVELRPAAGARRWAVRGFDQLRQPRGPSAPA